MIKKFLGPSKDIEDILTRGKFLPNNIYLSNVSSYKARMAVFVSMLLVT